MNADQSSTSRGPEKSQGFLSVAWRRLRRDRYAMTGLYVIGGLGSTRFAGDDRFTVNFGAGYRFVLTDSVAIHMDFRDHMYDIDVLGEEKTAHNLEATLGVTVFF